LTESKNSKSAGPTTNSKKLTEKNRLKQKEVGKRGRGWGVEVKNRATFGHVLPVRIGGGGVGAGLGGANT